MDAIATAKELLSNPQVWPLLFLAAIIFALQGAIARWLERQVGRVTASAASEFFGRCLLFLLIVHAIIGVTASFWCLLFSSFPSPVYTYSEISTSFIGRVTGYVSSAVLSAMPVLFASISRSLSRLASGNSPTEAGPDLASLISKSLIGGTILAMALYVPELPPILWTLS